MIADLLPIAGGVGLFLLGVTMMAEGLRELAGDGMRAAIARFTSTPTRGAVAGAVTTALIRSSSATTVMAVGFVGAGLMTFPQALGVIFGANIGTTTTGWLVAILGFRLDFGLIAPPFLFLGMLARLFGGRGLRAGGWALAGFALIFVGLDLMRDGMAAFEGAVTPDSFPGAGWPGRLQLMAIGVALTLVTQSSSAGVAVALTALGVGAIDLTQAAAMVVGMDVGTTATAALAAAGGSTAMRRTGLAHVVYNVLTGIAAILLLDPLLAGGGAIVALGGGGHDPQLVLVAFHSLFNLLGVAAVLPVAAPFARLIERLVPERGPGLARRLDMRLAGDPEAAADIAAATLRDAVALLAKPLADGLRGADGDAAIALAAAEAHATAAAASALIGEASRRAASPPTRAREAACLHAVDHLDRLAHRMEQSAQTAALPRDRTLWRLGRVAAATIEAPDAVERLARLHALIQRRREPFRAALLRAAAEGRISPAEAGLRLDAQRWLQRSVYHLSRIAAHLRAARGG
jgi:phosphate:Na+ symporter